jgi:CheY-like chemotaxis protein
MWVGQQADALRADGPAYGYVLVVEEHAREHEPLALFLGRGGVVVVGARSTAEALLQVMANGAPALVVADLCTAVSTALELIDVLRGDAALEGVPCLIVTGRSDIEPWPGARFLVAPVRPETVVETARHMLRRAPRAVTRWR